MGAVESSLHVWQFSFRTEEVIVARRRIGHIRLTLGQLLRGEPMPVFHAMVRRSEYHSFVRMPAGLYVPKNVVRVICTVRGTISYRVIEGTCLYMCN